MSNLEVGVVGLPNVGKSTLFNALTTAGIEAQNYPFCTIEPNVGIVNVPDTRLDTLTKMYNPKKKTPATIRFVDIAGLVKGASKGEGLGNKFLEHIRQVDAILHIVRCFIDADITHVEGSVDPLRDIEIIDTELCLADLAVLEKYLDKLQKKVKSGDKDAKSEAELLMQIKKTLDEGIPLRTLELSDDERETLKERNFLTLKPVLYVANIAEDEISDKKNPFIEKIYEKATQEHAGLITLSLRIEEEIATLSDEDKKEFLASLGLDASGLERLIQASFKLLNLLTFLTAGEDECRAWTIEEGTKAPKAAGKIHSDIERGFIRAEIVSYDDLISAGTMTKAKERGKIRLEGKDYIMQDGDVTYFRFNV